MKNIPFLSPKFPDPEIIKKDLISIYESNWYTNMGPFEQKLTKGIEEYIGGDVKVSIICNATIALMMAVNKLCLKGRKKVIIQSFTFCAGAHAILWGGYEPVFADINMDDWQMDIESVREYLEVNSKEVAGIILCNTFGIPNKDIDMWENLAKEYAMPLIVDSAAGLGSEYLNGAKMGGRGDCEIFSFHATKPFGIGEGGAIVSRDTKLIHDFNNMKNFAFEEHGNSLALGLNAKVPEVTCAIGLRVLDNFENRLKRRREILKIYKDLLKNKNCVFPPNDNLSTISFLSILVEEDRDKLMERYTIQGIVTKKYYDKPLHLQTHFTKFETITNLANTNNISKKILSLPVLEEFSDEDLRRISDIIA